MNRTDISEVQKGELRPGMSTHRSLIRLLCSFEALLPPHSQTPVSDNRLFEALTMDHTVPFDFYSFMRTGRLTVAMESHADVWDVFPGARCESLFHHSLPILIDSYS
jgi:hypothetical protein